MCNLRVMRRAAVIVMLAVLVGVLALFGAACAEPVVPDSGGGHWSLYTSVDDFTDETIVTLLGSGETVAAVGDDDDGSGLNVLVDCRDVLVSFENPGVFPPSFAAEVRWDGGAIEHVNFLASAREREDLPEWWLSRAAALSDRTFAGSARGDFLSRLATHSELRMRFPNTRPPTFYTGELVTDRFDLTGGVSVDGRNAPDITLAEALVTLERSCVR